MKTSQAVSRRFARFAGGVVFFATTSCGSGSGDEPRWLDLSLGFTPRPIIEIATEWAGEPGREASVRPHEDTGEVWIETTFRADEWKPGDGPGQWWVERPTDGAFGHYNGEWLHLEAGERVFERLFAGSDPRPGNYMVDAERVHLALESTEPVPPEVTFGVRIGSGSLFNGRWRMRNGKHTGNGIPVWSGESEELRCSIPPNSCLRMTFAWSGANSEDYAARILLDDRAIWSSAENGELSHVVALPADGRDSARLTFEVRGAPGIGFFFEPEITPVSIGDYRKRPWESDSRSRPDVILFLADTFRADSMATYGSELGLTPNLDAFAASSMRFLRSRATASWTLPSIASILTGLHPGQHAATDQNLKLSYDLRTIAETFADSGYRTGAVTDSAFVSQGFGLDQGFEWFKEYAYPDWNVRRTIASALEFLDRDDGRPVFLFVHTYRTHGPYRRGPSEDSSDWDALIARGLERLEDDDMTGRGSRKRVFIELIDEFRELYRDGVRDLDTVFGQFWDETNRRGIFDNGYLVFTSDHGESFGDNGEVWHGKDLWEATVRVPLVIHGPGLKAVDVPWSVSLVDLPPTLAALAGVAPESAWSGESLLDVDAHRLAPSFLLEDARRRLTLVHGNRKIFAEPDADALARGEYSRAFDLEHDPGETHDLAGESEWASKFCAQYADQIRDLLDARTTPDELGNSASERPDLAKIGYQGN